MKQGNKVRHLLSGWIGIILITNTNNSGTWHNVRIYNKKTDTFTTQEFNENELEIVRGENNGEI